MSDLISLCLGFPVCTYFLKLLCQIDGVMYVLLLALHLALDSKSYLCSESAPRARPDQEESPCPLEGSPAASGGSTPNGWKGAAI